jgi:transposase
MQWAAITAQIDASKLVFLDESSINTGMTRLYGRSQGKTRVVEYVPDVRFERTSIVSTIRLDGTMTPCAFRGSMNGERFVEYIKNNVAPTLKQGDILALDNLKAHKVKGVSEAIEAVGANVLYLPPYSPEFNPIELMWSKMKANLRKTKARSFEAIERAIETALKTVSLTDTANWFSHCGY